MQTDGKYHKFYQMEMELDKINLIEVKRVPTLLIKNYQPKDSKELARVFNLVFSQSRDPFPTITEKDLEDLPSDRIFLAELDGRMVGFLMCGIKRIEGKQVGVIGYVGVLKDYRRKGIATALAIEAGKYFLKQKLTRIIAEVYYLNKDSYRFIEGFGFKQTAVIHIPTEETSSSLYRVKPQRQK